MLDSSRDVGASNNRRLAALYCNRVSGFEVYAEGGKHLSRHVFT
jgi:hypothetical protein